MKFMPRLQWDPGRPEIGLPQRDPYQEISSPGPDYLRSGHSVGRFQEQFPLFKIMRENMGCGNPQAVAGFFRPTAVGVIDIEPTVGRPAFMKYQYSVGPYPGLPITDFPRQSGDSGFFDLLAHSVDYDKIIPQGVIFLKSDFFHSPKDSRPNPNVK